MHSSRSWIAFYYSPKRLWAIANRMYAYWHNSRWAPTRVYLYSTTRHNSLMDCCKLPWSRQAMARQKIASVFYGSMLSIISLRIFTASLQSLFLIFALALLVISLTRSTMLSQCYFWNVLEFQVDFLCDPIDISFNLLFAVSLLLLTLLKFLLVPVDRPLLLPKLERFYD